MTSPQKAGSKTAVLRIWEAAEAAYGTNAERPLQIVIGNTGPDGERFFFIGILPGRSDPSFVPMESRLPLVVREEDPAHSLESGRDRLGRVTVIRGDIQEDEFGNWGAFLEALRIEA
jgi:hypothetical protein